MNTLLQQNIKIMIKEEKEILIADYFLVNRTKAFGRIYYSFPGGSTELTKNDLNFTTSLDWISPVLDKIVKQGFDYLEDTSMGFKSIFGVITTLIKGNIEFSGCTSSRIDSIVEVVIQYIEWFNKQKENETD